MEDDFKTISGYKGYVSKPEITVLDPRFLVQGSKNVLIDYAQRVISRLGYSLYNQAATAGSTGCKGSYDWNTSSRKQFSMRSNDDKLYFDWNGTYNVLVSGMATPYLQFTKVWDDTEKIDVLLWVMGDTNFYKWSGGVAKIRSSTSTTLTKQGVIAAQTTIAFIAGTTGTIAPTITDSANNFLNAGFAPGDTLTVGGSAANSRNFIIGSVAAGTITLIMTDVLISEAAGTSITLHNGEPTWISSRFLTAGTRKIHYNGVDYTYTGGENTATLTGLTSFPSVSLGDPAWQTPITVALPSSITSPYPNFRPDLCGVQLNQFVIASTKSQDIFGSSTTDYTDFTLTSPRAPADPFHVTMDNYATCIIAIDNLAQTTSSLMFGGGTSEFFQLSFQMSQDNSQELVRMVKFKTANGSGLISTDAIAPIKNTTVYISREPALDTIDHLQNIGKNDLPLSDLIKNDFDNYDFTGAHVKYWKRSIYIALPAEGIFLIYDLMRSLWQPPQTAPIARWAIINDWLYGHSSLGNETYKMFDGTNDKGNLIPQIARFAYNNGGRRDMIKNMSEYWTDGYISSGGILDMTQYFGFNGVSGQQTMVILGNDSAITNLNPASPMGSEPMGTLDGLPFEMGDPTLNGMNRFWQIDTLSAIDYTEQFVEYSMDTLDGQFAIVAHGSNQWSAGTSPISHKK